MTQVDPKHNVTTKRDAKGYLLSYKNFEVFTNIHSFSGRTN